MIPKVRNPCPCPPSPTWNNGNSGSRYLHVFSQPSVFSQQCVLTSYIRQVVFLYLVVFYLILARSLALYLSNSFRDIILVLISLFLFITFCPKGEGHFNGCCMSQQLILTKPLCLFIFYRISLLMILVDVELHGRCMALPTADSANYFLSSIVSSWLCFAWALVNRVHIYSSNQL